MPNNGGCPPQAGNNKPFMAETNPLNNVKNIIAVMSGKGGVGKSTMTAIIASELNKLGLKVGILDADITGPSIPRLMGVAGQNAMFDEAGIRPVKTEEGIDIMSMNLLMEYEEQAVIWRGPLIAGAVKQFWTDVIWGDLDFLLIDMPPGTGDVPLTVMQSIPVTGVVMVSTPQNMVSMIVSKAVNMASKMDMKVLGVIENMSYINCPDCGKKIELYGKNAAEEAASKVGTKLLGELPMDSELIALSDQGRVSQFIGLKEEFKEIVEAILSSIEK